MISWTVVGTTPWLSGITEIVGSYSSTATASGSFSSTPSGSLDGGNFVNATATYSASGSSTYSSATIHSQGVTTISFSFSEVNTYSENRMWTASEYGFDTDSGTDPVVTSTVTGQYSHTYSTSTSQSGETTGAYSAQRITSTTQTQESWHEATTVETLFGSDEKDGFGSIWTTQSTTVEGVAETTWNFTVTNETSSTFILTTDLTRQLTYHTTTTLGETVTITAMQDTVIQADTRNIANAEILYVITNELSNPFEFSAASSIAQSGTRFTLSPRVNITEKEAAAYSRDTSEISSTEETSIVIVNNSRTTATTAVTAAYFRFPPTTTTYSTTALTTQASTVATNTTFYQPAITTGGTSNSITVQEFRTYLSIVPRQIGSIAFDGTVQRTTSYTATKTIEAAATSSTAETITTTFLFEIGGYTTTSGQATTMTARTSSVSANTYLPVVQASTSTAGDIFQFKYGTIGAVVDTKSGGWITATTRLPANVFFSGYYALNGSNRLATTVLPNTNRSVTINKTGITWTESVSANSSIDGATSRQTTSSMTFDVSGSTKTTSYATQLNHFGGYVGDEETFVQKALPGVYKDAIDGTTTSFDGGDMVYSQKTTLLPMRAWGPIKDVRGFATTEVARPLAWGELRNRYFLPPNMPPYLDDYLDD